MEAVEAFIVAVSVEEGASSKYFLIKMLNTQQTFVQSLTPAGRRDGRRLRLRLELAGTQSRFIFCR